MTWSCMQIIFHNFPLLCCIAFFCVLFTNIHIHIYPDFPHCYLPGRIKTKIIPKNIPERRLLCFVRWCTFQDCEHLLKEWGGHVGISKGLRGYPTGWPLRVKFQCLVLARPCLGNCRVPGTCQPVSIRSCQGLQFWPTWGWVWENSGQGKRK